VISVCGLTLPARPDEWQGGEDDQDDENATTVHDGSHC
jgi:hypothetical protein